MSCVPCLPCVQTVSCVPCLPCVQTMSAMSAVRADHELCAMVVFAYPDCELCTVCAERKLSLIRTGQGSKCVHNQVTIRFSMHVFDHFAACTS